MTRRLKTAAITALCALFPATMAAVLWGAMNTPTRDGVPRVAPIASITPTDPAPR